jgi:hypothetical protein
MESHEVLREAIEKVGAKSISSDLKVSTALVYKWCAKSGGADGASGALNPLDRVMAICNQTESQEPVRWLCEQLKGFFVENPVIDSGDCDTEYIQHTQKILQEFTTLLQSLSQSIADDGIIDTEESQMIRSQWELLKKHGEEFVSSCEEGVFNIDRDSPA